MYADVSIDIPLGDKLSVPESAVLRTGNRTSFSWIRAEGTWR
jgi:hypothetical protein